MSVSFQEHLLTKGHSSAHLSGCTPFSPLPVNPDPHQVSAPYSAPGILTESWREPFSPSLPLSPQHSGQLTGKAPGTLGMIPSSALCPAKLPAPLMLNYSLRVDRLFGRTLPRHSLVRGRGPYPLFMWVPIPFSRMPLTPLFSLLHALLAPHLCQRAKSPFGARVEVGCPH